MKRIFKIITTSAASALWLNLGVATAVTEPDPCGIGVPEEVRNASGCDGGGNDQITIIVQNILYTIIGLAGLIAVIYVIIGGFSYMTSAGDPGKAKKARDTILYAVLGLIVCALAFAIVNFVINSFLG